MFYSIFKDLKATRGSTTYSTWVIAFYSIFEVQRLLALPIGCPCISHGKNAMFTDFQFFGVCDIESHVTLFRAKPDAQRVN